MRHLLAAAVLSASLVAARSAPAGVVASWYPITHVGNTWVYEDESRDADNLYGMANPTIGRWTTTETVTNVSTESGSTAVTIRATIDHVVRINGWDDDPAFLTDPETRLVIRGDCIDRIGGDASEFCFPMAAGGEWGRTPSTPADEEGVWRVRALNGDRFGTPGAQTFHVYGYQGAGDATDYWFQPGVGIVQRIEVHHGTYDEFRRRLVRATIDGVTRPYKLRPARTAPLEVGECRAGWQRWVRADGSLLKNLAACEAYARNGK
jgi:hypothetical protein